MSGAAADPGDIFDRFAALAQGLLGVPAALVSVVETDRQRFVGAIGLTGDVALERMTPLWQSVCRLVVGSGRPLIVDDTRSDERVAGHEAIEALDVAAYAGVPIRQGDDVVGALCAIDHQARTWSSRDIDVLARLAELCSSELELRVSRQDADQARHLAEDARDAAMVASARDRSAARSSDRVERRARLLLALSEALTATSTIADVERAVERTARSHLGVSSTELVPDGEVPADPGPAVRHLPLVSSAGYRGTLVMTWPDDAQPTADDDVELRGILVALANYTAAAIDRAHLLQERRDAAALLQHAMLTRLPDRDDVELSALYRPATALNQVGGDWYDAVELADGGLALVIGDVAGHDLHAAARMGELRNTLRALVVDRRTEPADLLRRLDRVVADLRLDVAATAALAVVTFDEQPGARLCWSAAGHPRPVVITAAGAGFATGEADLLLGVDAETSRHDHSQRLAPGTTLLLYTDGLVSRPFKLPSEGFDRLLGACRSHLAQPLPQFLPAVLEEVGTEHDDCALIALRLP